MCFSASFVVVFSECVDSLDTADASSFVVIVVVFVAGGENVAALFLERAYLDLLFETRCDDCVSTRDDLDSGSERLRFIAFDPSVGMEKLTLSRFRFGVCNELYRVVSRCKSSASDRICVGSVRVEKSSFNAIMTDFRRSILADVFNLFVSFCFMTISSSTMFDNMLYDR